MRALPGWDATCLRRGTAKCVYRGLTGLWCDRAHFDREVTAAADPAAALLHVINTRTTFCAGSYAERLQVIGLPTYADTNASNGNFNMTAWTSKEARRDCSPRHGPHYKPLFPELSGIR